MYKRKTYHFDNSYEVEEYHDGRYGAPGMPRLEKKKATKDQIRKRNRYNKEKRIRRKIQANFSRDDYWITITYRADERPEDLRAAAKDIRGLLSKLRRFYKKSKQEMKWMLLTEIGSRGGVHHHIILNRIPDVDLALRKSWVKGGTHFTLLYEEGGFRKLANYLSKEPDEENRMKGSKYSCSRNLIIPVPKIKIMKRKTWKGEPKAKTGYFLEKETYHEGMNPVTGHKYRSYTMVRLDRRRE